jgi:hypothetical protein
MRRYPGVHLDVVGDTIGGSGRPPSEATRTRPSAARGRPILGPSESQTMI